MATPTPQVFTLEAVNALVPRLNLIVGRQLVRRSEIESKLKALSELTGEVPDDLGPSPDDSPEVRTRKRELTEEVEAYQTGWGELEDMGAVLKDPRTGLLDFYGRVEGKLVWLCWKYGEEKISHYHALDEGFSGRKAIGDRLKQRLLN